MLGIGRRLKVKQLNILSVIQCLKKPLFSRMWLKWLQIHSISLWAMQNAWLGPPHITHRHYRAHCFHLNCGQKLRAAFLLLTVQVQSWGDHCQWPVELQTNLREVWSWTITEKALLWPSPEGQAALRHNANQPAHHLWYLHQQSKLMSYCGVSLWLWNPKHREGSFPALLTSSSDHSLHICNSMHASARLPAVSSSRPRP